MANEEHVKILKQGVDAWNKWFEENQDIMPDLSKADLSHASLSHVSLRHANLSNANLSRAHFSGADLSEANLREANLWRADLVCTNFSGADLSGADLSEANLHVANLRGANLSWANLSGADLSEAHLSKANLSEANMNQANIQDLTLAEVSLSGAKNVYLNGNQLRDTVISPTTTGPWLTLRRRYTGTKFFLHLCMLIAFALPYVGKTLFWKGVYEGEKALAQQIKAIEGDLGGDLEITVNYHNQKKPVEGQLQMIANTEPVKLTITELCERVKKNTVSQPVWKMLLGLDRHWWYPITAIILIFYNIMRLHLTLSVTELNDEQIRTGYAPRLSGDGGWREYLNLLFAKPAGYEPLIWCGHITSLLFWMALGILVFHSKDWLTAEVYLWAGN